VQGAKEGAEALGIIVTDFIDRPTVRDALTNHNFDFAKAIGKDSAEQLRDAMKAGMDAGESVPELKKRIAEVFEGWQDWRGDRIARTESTRALEMGRVQQWKETGVVVGKEWDAMNDSCPFCQDMDGKIVGIADPYWTVNGKDQTVEFNGKEITLNHNYADVLSPPLHPNCRCSLQPVLIEQ